MLAPPRNALATHTNPREGSQREGEEETRQQTVEPVLWRSRPLRLCLSASLSLTHTNTLSLTQRGGYVMGVRAGEPRRAFLRQGIGTDDEEQVCGAHGEVRLLLPDDGQRGISDAAAATEGLKLLL